MYDVQPGIADPKFINDYYNSYRTDFLVSYLNSIVPLLIITLALYLILKIFRNNMLIVKLLSGFGLAISSLLIFFVYKIFIYSTFLTLGFNILTIFSALSIVFTSYFIYTGFFFAELSHYLEKRSFVSLKILILSLLPIVLYFPYQVLPETFLYLEIFALLSAASLPMFIVYIMLTRKLRKNVQINA